MLCAQTSGEFGSGTGRGLVLRVKMSLEASSSCKLEEPAVEGAVFETACSMPAAISSVLVSGSSEIAEGAIWGEQTSRGLVFDKAIDKERTEVK